MTSNKSLKGAVCTIASIFVAAIFARGQPQTRPKEVDFCDVVATPADYYGQVISVDVILSPAEHVLTLFGSACVPKEGDDATTQAILPADVESLPNGKKLRSILKRQRPAKVEVVGIFESRTERYGLDATRFRFSISQINSVSKYEKPVSPLHATKSNQTNTFTIIDPYGYMAAHDEPDPHKRVVLLEKYAAQAPDSSLAASLLPFVYHDLMRTYYHQLRDYPNSVKYADKLLAFGDKIDVPSQDEARKIRAEAQDKMKEGVPVCRLSGDSLRAEPESRASA